MVPQVKHLLDSFLKDVVEGAEEFTRDAPFSSDNTDVHQATAFIEGAKAQVCQYMAQTVECVAQCNGHVVLQHRQYAPAFKQLCEQ
jgi:adenosylmethionine-8-amino-7-oxononanoate aminotransferase